MISTAELARRTGYSPSRILQLAKIDQIPGAERHSFGWLFPDDAAEKPPLTDRPKSGPKGPRKKKEAQP